MSLHTTLRLIGDFSHGVLRKHTTDLRCTASGLLAYPATPEPVSQPTKCARWDIALNTISRLRLPVWPDSAVLLWHVRQRLLLLHQIRLIALHTTVVLTYIQLRGVKRTGRVLLCLIAEELSVLICPSSSHVCATNVTCVCANDRRGGRCLLCMHPQSALHRLNPWLQAPLFPLASQPIMRWRRTPGSCIGQMSEKPARQFIT